MSTTKRKKSQSIRNSFHIRGGTGTLDSLRSARQVVEHVQANGRHNLSKFNTLLLRDTKLFLCVCHETAHDAYGKPQPSSQIDYILCDATYSDLFENPIILIPEGKAVQAPIHGLDMPFFPYDIIPASLSSAFSDGRSFNRSEFQMLMDLVHELNEQRNGRPERHSYTTPEAYKIVNGFWDHQESCAKRLLDALLTHLTHFESSDGISLPELTCVLGTKYTNAARAAHLSHLIFSTSSYCNKKGHRSALVHFESTQLLEHFIDVLSDMVNRVCDTGYMVVETWW